MRNKRSFRRSPGTARIFVLLSIGILFIFTSSLIFGGFFLSMVGLFELIGVTYSSKLGLLLFALLVFMLGFLFEAAAKMIITVSRLAQPSPFVFLLWKSIVYLTFTWLTIYTVDELVRNVTMTLGAEWIFALALVVVDYVFDEKRWQKKNSHE
ncbi:YrvL family regulatory protein [Halobacillus rhizosphaerae]|uniref:YrvL family regulatory protein n=1 Tax=Halobacillus rhizosphaerae TaxID=3064889 RepID=UPI00398AD4E7